MTHRQAVWLMVGVTLMWSIAGVVTRFLDSARGFEITFWRSLFNALALVLMLGWLRGRFGDRQGPLDEGGAWDADVQQQPDGPGRVLCTLTLALAADVAEALLAHLSID